jgi:hypothetical protein
VSSNGFRLIADRVAHSELDLTLTLMRLAAHPAATRRDLCTSGAPLASIKQGGFAREHKLWRHVSSDCALTLFAGACGGSNPDDAVTFWSAVNSAVVVTVVDGAGALSARHKRRRNEEQKHHHPGRNDRRPTRRTNCWSV